MSTNNQITITDARATLPDLVERVGSYLDRVVITVNGKPKATLVSTEELESLEETAKIVSVPGIKKALQKSEAEIASGQFISFEDLD